MIQVIKNSAAVVPDTHRKNPVNLKGNKSNNDLDFNSILKEEERKLQDDKS